MEIKIGSQQISNLLNVLSWIIFLGLCVETGGIICNAVYAHFNATAAKNFWNGADLSAVYAYDKGYFFTIAGLMAIAATMKTLIFYLLVKLFYNNKFSLARPFDPNVISLVFRIAYLCVGAGIFSHWGVGYAGFIESKGVQMPDIEHLRLGGADVWLFMAVVLFVIGQVFKKGTDLQTESDLTV